MVPASVHMTEVTLRMAATSVRGPKVKCSRLLLLKEILQDQKVGLTEAHIMSLLWPWVLKHVKFCGCPLRERTKINLFTIN